MLQTLSGPAVLLVWLYVMANVIVLGAEVNWYRLYAAGLPRLASSLRPRPRRERERRERAVGVAPLPVVAELGHRARRRRRGMKIGS